MRLIKMLGLAAFSALAAMAFLGAGTASAVVHSQYGLCKAEKLVLCTAANLIPVGSGTLLGTATNPTLEGTLTETCEKGTVKGKITGVLDEVGQLKGEIPKESVTFTGCKPCTVVTVENLPYAAELKMLTNGGELLTWPWELIVKGKIKATLDKCIFGAGSCIFEAAEIKGSITHTATGSTATILEPLTWVGGSLGEGFCGKTGLWNAKYALKWLLTAGGEDLVFPTLLGEV
jgi:hypothetical protein